MAAYHKNCKGDFIVEDRGHCHFCTLPQKMAPGLMASDGTSCYFVKQPETEQEIDSAINAISVSFCSAVKYCGKNKRIINKILSTPYIKPDCVTEATKWDKFKGNITKVKNSLIR
jgi:hypothetical protein